MPEWTIDTIKEYFEKILAEKDKAINIALSAAKEAVGVAEKNAEKWRDQANEWRGAMNDREKNFMQRSEFLAYKEAAEKAHIVEKERADRTQGKSEGYTRYTGYIISAILIIFYLLNYLKG